MIEMGEGLQAFFYGTGTGIGGLTVFMALRWVAKFTSERWDKKEANLDADAALIDGKKNDLIVRLENDSKRLAERVQKLEARATAAENSHADCERRLTEVERRATTAEATLQGMGDARNMIQRSLAADHLDEKAERKE